MPLLAVLWEAALQLLFLPSVLLAQNATPTTEVHIPNFWEDLFYGSTLTLVYGVIGILLVALGFKVFEWITPRLDVERELAEKQNIAVAVVCSAIILGICVIVAVAVR